VHAHGVLDTDAHEVLGNRSEEVPEVAEPSPHHLQMDPQDGREPAQHYLGKAQVLEAQGEGTDAPNPTGP
jgi:hypothetical protein